MIVITNPGILTDEAHIINRLFEEGLQLLHIRKPGIDIYNLKSLLRLIHEEYYDRLVLHQHYNLAGQYGINRIHFTESNRPDFDKTLKMLGNDQEWIFSTSTHSIEDFNRLSHRYEYAFLSPVYNSISKPGYAPDTDIIESTKRRSNFNTKLIALGGISYKNNKQILEAGFDGVAVLGNIWNSGDPICEFKTFNDEK
ncbi:thiamine phosphate synthase [Flavobacterium suzhouense]|uniref:Thiamine phosphate synthase n=1 Tax=Flavobacterium suzhouense TaxID=1529638 RepID=A0ABW5NTW4_9FLAO